MLHGHWYDLTNTCSHFVNETWQTVDFHLAFYLIEVPYSEWESPPWRIVCLSFAVSVAGDIQVYPILNVILKISIGKTLFEQQKWH